jgi:hypothetical protein
VVLACALAIGVRAARIGALPRLALALSITAFGLACIAPIAMTREALGNWHLQYALPAVCGAYCAGYQLWREDRTLFSGLPCFTLLAVLLASSSAYVKGFREYGPSYQAYIREIEDYSRSYLTNPDQPRPFPATGLDADMLLFLSAHGHPVFEALAGGQLAPLPADARLFVGAREVTLPFGIRGAAPAVVRLTVILPANPLPAHPTVRAVLAQIGDSSLLLRPIDPKCSDLPACSEPGVSCYCGLVVPKLVAPGRHAVRFELCE